MIKFLKLLFHEHKVYFMFDCPYREYGKCTVCGARVERYKGEIVWRRT